jgi:hypothetical protein
MNKIYQEDFGGFQSESLKVDYIRFNLNYLESNEMLKLASYFGTLGFNSYQKDRDESKSRQEIKFDSKNQLELVFVIYTKYQRGTNLEFSGLHATKLYGLIKQKHIKWKNLTEFNPILCRFDICYDRLNQLTDKIDSSEFINVCFQQFQISHPHKNLVVEKNQQGLLLKIGNRRSARHYRLYTKDNFLRFEFEIKRNVIKDLHNLLLEYRLEEFEKTLSYTFFKYSFEIFQCSRHPSHIDWLMSRIRPYQYKNRLSSETSVINSHYIRQFAFQEFQQKLDLITLLQLLVYVQTLDYQTKTLTSSFRQFRFPLRDFLNYASKASNQYQLIKLKEFFNVLSQNLVIECFTDKSYRMLVTIPESRVYKSKQNIWLVDLWIAEELFDYLHPFIFSDFFNKKLTMDEFQVLFEIVKTFSSSNIRKEFNIQEFLHSYPSTLNNKRKKTINEYFIRYIKIFHEQQKLQNHVLLLPSNQTCNINQLNSTHLYQKLVIFESIDVIFS